MKTIAIRIDAGEKTCGRCLGQQVTLADVTRQVCGYFRGVDLGRPGEKTYPRLPQCLAAESDLKRLVDAAGMMLGTTMTEQNKIENLREALQPFEVAQ